MFELKSINPTTMHIPLFLSAILKDSRHYILPLMVDRQFFAIWLLFFSAALVLLYGFGLAPQGVVEIGERIIAVASGGADGRITPERLQYVAVGAPMRPCLRRHAERVERKRMHLR